MVTALTLFVIVVIHAERAASSPLRVKRSPRDLATHPVLYSSYQNSGSHSVSVLPQHVYINNSPQLGAPISQFYFHSKLHVIPRPNIIQSAIQHVSSHENNNPIVSHHSVSQSSPNANTTHSTSVFVHHNHFIPINDLSVIPLQRHHQERLTHYRAMEKSADDEESSNGYRRFYGGHGAGLFFGGQGAGHGFYAYGK